MMKVYLRATSVTSTIMQSCNKVTGPLCRQIKQLLDKNKGVWKLLFLLGDKEVKIEFETIFATDEIIWLK